MMSEVSEPASVFGSFEYMGVKYPNVVLASSIDAMQTFTVREDDVWIITYPKSGTHWMMEIVGLIQTRGKPDNIDRSVGAGTIEMIDLNGQTLPTTREEELKNPINKTPMTEVFDRKRSPRVITSHLPLEMLPPTLLSTAKVIYIARNPKDVLQSAYNFVKHTPKPIPWENKLTDFVNGKWPYGEWDKHVTSFWQIKDDDNVLFCFYEHMKKDPIKAISRVAEFLNEHLNDEDIAMVVENSSFSGMKKTYDNVQESSKNVAKGGGHFSFMNKGVSGSWKTIFTVAQNEMFDEWYQEKMSDTDLQFSFE